MPVPITRTVCPARASRSTVAGAPATSNAARATASGKSSGRRAKSVRSKRMAVPVTSTRSVSTWMSPIFSRCSGVRVRETSDATRSPGRTRSAAGWRGPTALTSPRSIPPEPVTGFCILPRSRDDPGNLVADRLAGRGFRLAQLAERSGIDGQGADRDRHLVLEGAGRRVEAPGDLRKHAGWIERAVQAERVRVHGSRATMRRGPPEPPAIFIGSATTHAPDSGSSSRRATFSSPGHVRPVGDLVDDEVLRGAVVDRGRVHAEGADLALAHEVLGGFLSVRGEVQLRRVAGRVVAEVGLLVRPAGAPAGLEEHDRAGRESRRGAPPSRARPRGVSR